MTEEEEQPLNIGDECKVLTGVYADIRVKIVDLPDKYDARYSVSRDGMAGLRFHRSNLELITNEDGDKP